MPVSIVKAAIRTAQVGSSISSSAWLPEEERQSWIAAGFLLLSPIPRPFSEIWKGGGNNKVTWEENETLGSPSDD